MSDPTTRLSPVSEEQKAATERSIRRTKRAIGILAVICVALSVYLYIQNLPPPNGKYDAFARCIANTSTTFYGAWWCPHCAAQKQEFGDAAKYLPYVECSNQDSSEKQSCIDIGIAHYPTWFFPGGVTSTGVEALTDISAKTGCPLPTST